MKLFTESEANFLWRLIYKLFVVKEIWSKEGVLHFRRFRLLATPWFNIYLHNILKSDEDAHPHDHPWHFYSFILWGGYSEAWLGAYEDYRFWRGDSLRVSRRTPGSMVYHHAKDFHKISLLKKSAWTLVFTFGKRRPSWGYQTPHGWIDHRAYRQLKNEGKL